jgi:hypothetical protein
MDHNIDQQRQAGALHEAAHAVIAVQYRSRIRERGVSIDEMGCGEAHLRKRTWPQMIEAAREGGGEFWEAHQELVRQEIYIDLARPVAEALLGGEDLTNPDVWDLYTEDPADDFYCAEELLQALHPDADDEALGMKRLKYVEETAALLSGRRTWATVKRLAQRLMKTGHLDADEATEIIESASSARSR